MTIQHGEGIRRGKGYHDNGIDRRHTVFTAGADIELMQDAYIDDSERRHDIYLSVINESLLNVTKKQEIAYRLITGITPDGKQREPMTEREVSELLNISKTTARVRYMYAENAVLRRLLRLAIYGK